MSKQLMHVTALLLAGSLLLVFPHWLFQEPRAGLDFSWQLAMHLQFEQGSVFGKDFIFTYGPLGVLFSRFPFSKALQVILAFDAFFFLLLLYCYLRLLYICQTPTQRLAAAMAVLCAATMPQASDQVFVLLAILLFALLLYRQGKDAIDAVVATMLAPLLFFMKFHVGLLAVVLLNVSLIAAFFDKKSRKTLASLLLLQAALFVFLGLFLPVDVSAYLESSIAISNCYQDALALSSGVDLPQLLTLALLTATLGLYLLACIKQRSWVLAHELLYLLPLFLLYKQSIIRPDSAHVSSYLSLAPLFVGLLLFGPAVALRHPKLLLFSLHNLIGLVFALSTLGIEFPITRAMRAVNYLQDYTRIATPEKELLGIRPELGERGIFATLPTMATIDALPDNILTPFRAGIFVKPRPVPASFQVCSKWLDAQNAAYFKSSKAPQFVLLRNSCIDNYYCFWQETQSKQTLRQHYQTNASSSKSILLKRRETPLQPLAPSLIHSSVQQFSSAVAVPESSDATLLVSLEVDYSLAGAVSRLLFRAAPLLIEFTLSDGVRIRHRVTPALLESKSPVAFYQSSVDELTAYFASAEQEFSANSKRITALRLLSPHEWAFSPRIKVSFYDTSGA